MTFLYIVSSPLCYMHYVCEGILLTCKHACMLSLSDSLHQNLPEYNCYMYLPYLPWLFHVFLNLSLWWTYARMLIYVKSPLWQANFGQLCQNAPVKKSLSLSHSHPPFISLSLEMHWWAIISSSTTTQNSSSVGYPFMATVFDQSSKPHPLGIHLLSLGL